MIADPLAISAAAPTPALSLAVIDSSKPYTAVRRDSGGEYQLTISHTPSRNGSVRHYLNVSRTVVATSPVTGVDSQQTMSVSLAFSVPPFGFDTNAKTAMYELLDDIVRQATLAKIFNRES